MIDLQTNPYVKQELKHAKNASIAIGVVTKDETFITGDLFEHLGEYEIGDYLFEIGSTTKTFTSLLLAKLVQEKIISLDEPIKSYKREYEKALSYNGKDITFKHLSTHLSGLPREDMKTIRKRMKKNKHDKDNPYKYYSEADFHQFYLDFDLKREIDKKWKYSNIGVGLLGNLLVDIVGATSYEEAIKTHILTPLQLHDTCVTPSNEQMNRYVPAYNKKGARIPPLEIPAMAGAGALKSTIKDMLMYLQYQLGLRESSLSQAIQMTHELHGRTPWKTCHMGLGWMLETKKWSDYPVIHHGGTTMGFHTYCGFVKEQQIGIVIFSTIQLKLFRMVKMLLQLTDGVNVKIAESIFKDYIEKQKER
ncbi:serine hydrolase domain-containing protein [Alkalihalobacillus sp. LMS39]|uniref:serine hydrolase domain-containing protein n=1 Tax=Alkalihalobacillus sp. LMS39 TaxID=2924032 RepID=UPI001FB344F8|nr:serine hydrolase domain-containing protein [Alkalihalobacillus sp. LMS39]UOE95826.1 beta-lactamase family protein [Alkalihalobacillus sp. LMS39]